MLEQKTMMAQLPGSQTISPIHLWCRTAVDAAVFTPKTIPIMKGQYHLSSSYHCVTKCQAPQNEVLAKTMTFNSVCGEI